MNKSSNGFRVSFKQKGSRSFGLVGRQGIAVIGSMSDYPEVEAEYERYMKTPEPSKDEYDNDCAEESSEDAEQPPE